MLEQIIDSKVDSAVLSFFLIAPPRSFSAIELSKRLNFPIAKVVFSLHKLAQHGQLKSFSKKGKKYYLVNAKYKLLPEIKDYFIKNGPKYDDELFGAIKKLGEVRGAYLSGLFTGYANLPVDLLLVGKINLKKLDTFLVNASKMMGQEINYSIMTMEEFRNRRNTFDRFIKDIFDYNHIVVVEEPVKTKRVV